jgi:oxygen-independent coproporphyrinogen-3 oxidase
MAIAKELQMRKSEFEKEQVETIYFGGGTPLNSDEINF